MVCCRKRRTKQRQVMARRLFENNAFKVLRDLKNKSPDILQDELLDQYHRKCHMLYKGAIKLKPPNKVFINQVIELHIQCMKEMKIRGMKHDSPLQYV